MRGEPSVEWIRTARSRQTPPAALNRIQHLRRLILVHSCIYYQLNDNLVSDHQWMEWAQELLQMQVTFTHEVGFYDELFADWEGQSGFHLTYDQDIQRVATRLLHQRNQQGKAAPPTSEPATRRRLKT